MIDCVTMVKKLKFFVFFFLKRLVVVAGPYRPFMTPV